MQKTTKLVSVVDCLRLVDQIQSDLLAKRWDLALLRLSELNKCLIEIREDAQLMRHTQSDFKYRLSSMPSSLSKLRDIVSGADTNADLRFLNRDLQSIQDNLKLIEYHIKK
jgi:predicted  nucleic acid-binding Zn-ribbon protein